LKSETNRLINVSYSRGGDEGTVAESGIDMPATPLVRRREEVEQQRGVIRNK